MMIFLPLWVTADAVGGLKGPAQLRRSLRGLGAVSHQQARAGYIPAHCLPMLSEISDFSGNQKSIFIGNNL